MSLWRWTLCVALLACAAPRVQTSPRENDQAKAGSRARAVIRIRDFAFVPAALTVTAGDTIEWINEDAFAHTTTADSAAWSSPEIGEGGHFVFISKQPGRFSYHCAAHPTMHGTIIVQ